MALDFLKKPELGEIVNKEYSDAQLKTARDYIKKYEGNDLHADFLRHVPFDITPENREDYWKIYQATSPLTKEQTTRALVQDIENTISSYEDPLERLMYLRDKSPQWNDEVSQHFAPIITRYDNFFTADTMHKSRIAYQKNLQNRLLSFFNEQERYLDPMVSETEHIANIRAIERNNLWEYTDLDDNGRFGIKTATGEWLSAHTIEDEIQNYSEFRVPPKEEQFMVSMDSSKIIREYISPHLEQSRSKLLEQRKVSNEQLFISLRSGLVGKTDAAPIIVNMVQQSQEPMAGVIKDGLKGLFNNNIDNVPVAEQKPENILKDAGKLAGEMINLFNLRGEL